MNLHTRGKNGKKRAYVDKNVFIKNERSVTFYQTKHYMCWLVKLKLHVMYINCTIIMYNEIVIKLYFLSVTECCNTYNAVK